MSAIAKTRPGGETRSIIGSCLDVARGAHAMHTTGVRHARLGVAAGVPLINIHIFCNQEYYRQIPDVIRRGINHYLEANGK